MMSEFGGCWKIKNNIQACREENGMKKYKQQKQTSLQIQGEKEKKSDK